MVGGIGLEAKDAKIAIVPQDGRSKLLVKDGGALGGQWILVWLEEESSVDANVGANVQKDVLAAVTEFLGVALYSVYC